MAAPSYLHCRWAIEHLLLLLPPDQRTILIQEVAKQYNIKLEGE